jgi:hypothetical protein
MAQLMIMIKIALLEIKVSGKEAKMGIMPIQA